MNVNSFLEFIKKFNLLKFLPSRNITPFIICTMARSGTWYNREFFYFFNQLLMGKSKEEIISKIIQTDKKLKYFQKLDKNKFNFDSTFIQHWLCPGFKESYNGKYRKQWDKLEFYSDHLPQKFSEFMNYYNVYDKTNPLKNINAKIIYYYRNPLDQNISHFNAIQTNVVQKLNYYYDKSSQKNLRFKDIHQYLRVAGMDMYIKHYLSFKLMKEKFPNNVLILEYENLVRSPEENFRKVLNFINYDSKEKYEKEFKDALFLSSKESIVKLENKLGHAFSKSFKDKNKRQLSDGRTGRWKEILNNEDLKYIELRLNEFDLKLSDFIIN